MNPLHLLPGEKEGEEEEKEEEEDRLRAIRKKTIIFLALCISDKACHKLFAMRIRYPAPPLLLEVAKLKLPVNLLFGWIP